MAEFLQVGVTFEIIRRDNPNNWVQVTLCGTSCSLTPRQARETALLLINAAHLAEAQRDNQLVVLPPKE